MYQSGIITFIFLGLITDKYNAGTEIKLKVNLIKQSGEIEDEITEIPCILLSDINPNEGESKQGSFNCRKEGLNEPYYSLRLNNSDSISSIPTDEILLDPILTDEAIEKKKILNYSITENQSEDKIPATFISKHIYVNNTFIIINGTLSKEIKNDIKFTLPLVYPDGASLTCSLTKKEGNIGVMSCLIDRKIENKPIIIEQTIIKDGLNEIINFGSIVSDNNITCSNGILAEAEKRANIYVSFRQVSHLEKNGNNGFSFFFASLISQKYSAGIKLNMKINILIGGIKEEKTSVCTLQKDVEPEEGKQIQGDFKCEVRVEENEYTQINFNNSESITISPDNEEITGSSELEEENISPIATDIAINETKVAQNNTDNNLTDLAECIDYYEEENKIYIPPSFQISSVENLDKCNTEGKFRIKGKFSSDINDQMTFMLPLTFPSSKVKCKVYETKAEEEVEIICKIQKGFKLVDTFVIEDRMIKKRHKEMIFIKNKNIPISESIECKDYNSIRLEKVKKKKNIKFLILTIIQI